MKDRIRQLRKQLKLNQSEFGEKVGVKGNTIGNYELGLRSPSDAVIFSICREFGVNEMWLRTGTGEMFTPLSRSETIAHFAGELMKEEDGSFRRQLVEVLAQLDEREWEVLEGIAKKLALKKD